VICGRQDYAVESTVLELSQFAPDKVKGEVADVRDHEQVHQLFKFVDAEFGALDVLVNNAGVGIFRPVSELSIEEWKHVLDTNLTGAFYCSREALFRFGNKGEGSIVHISSLAGKHAFAGGAAYNASKFGLLGLGEAMMQDARSLGVRVSTVLPGSVATAFGGGAADAGADWKIWPEDIAEVVKMLLTMPERTLVSSVEVRPAFPQKLSKR